MADSRHAESLGDAAALILASLRGERDAIGDVLVAMERDELAKLAHVLVWCAAECALREPDEAGAWLGRAANTARRG